MKHLFTTLLLFISFIFQFNTPAADIDNIPIGIVKKLGKYIPLELNFIDSNGKKVLLKDLVNKPTIIDFAYYKCTGICTPLMTEIATSVNNVDLIPGKDYNLLTVSINPYDTFKDAYNKKMEIMNLINKKIPFSSWRFLTGDSASIKILTDAAGFHFEKQGNTFLHTGIVIFVSKDGKICRYLEPDFDSQGNFQILPIDFKIAIIDAARGEAVPVIDKVLRFCFAVQPKNEALVNYLFAAIGIFMILMVFAFVKFVLFKKHPQTSFITQKLKN